MATTETELLDTMVPFLEAPLNLEQLYASAGEELKEDKCPIDLI